MAAVTIIDIATNSSSDGAPSPSPRSFSLLSLPDPANDGASEMRDYMLVSSSSNATTASCDIYEIQTVLPHSGKYASYFIGSRVISDPCMHVTTRVDPLYLALAHFTRIISKSKDEADKLSKWQPWDQALGEMPTPILRALKLDPNLNINGLDGVGQLGHLMEASDMCGDDLILCKFSEERALKWLMAKFDRSVEGLRRRFQERKRRGAINKKELSNMQGGSGAFSSSFNVAEEQQKKEESVEEKKDSASDGEDRESALSNGEEQAIRTGALQLICDYIPAEWKNKLAKEVGISDEMWMGKKKTIKSTSESTGDEESTSNTTSGEKRSRSSWEGNIGQEDADALLLYTVGSSAGNSASVTPNDKSKAIRNAQSVGLKKLAKVNKKGMQSLTSFFGASKKKAKK